MGVAVGEIHCADNDLVGADEVVFDTAEFRQNLLEFLQVLGTIARARFLHGE